MAQELEITTVDHARQTRVCNKLAHDLDRYLSNYRTDDQKTLVEGEVIVAIGFLIGQRVKDQVKVQRWLTQISIAGLDAAQQEGEKK